MNYSLLFLVVSALAILSGSLYSSFTLRKTVKKYSPKSGLLPQAITLLVLTAQVSELVRVVQDVSFVNVAVALFLLAILVATKSGTESELL